MRKVSVTESSLKTFTEYYYFTDVINWDISISKEANSILNSELQLLMGVYLLRRKVVLSLQIDKKVILICLTSSLTAGFNFNVKLNSSKPENF